jgi:hypothetical protein
VTALQTSIDLEKYRLTLVESGIIENYVKPGVLIEAADVWEIKRQNLILTDQKEYCVMIISGHLSSVSKEAREVVASREFMGNTLAKALIVDSLGHRIVGNFYLSVNKPFIKTKIFSDRTEALKWLRIQLNEKSNKQLPTN